jgi:hypothetical protein
VGSLDCEAQDGQTFRGDLHPPDTPGWKPVAVANIWRVELDINASWGSVRSVIDTDARFARFAGLAKSSWTRTWSGSTGICWAGGVAHRQPRNDVQVWWKELAPPNTLAAMLLNRCVGPASRHVPVDRPRLLPAATPTVRDFWNHRAHSRASIVAQVFTPRDVAGWLLQRDAALSRW